MQFELNSKGVRAVCAGASPASPARPQRFVKKSARRGGGPLAEAGGVGDVAGDGGAEARGRDLDVGGGAGRDAGQSALPDQPRIEREGGQALRLGAGRL